MSNLYEGDILTWSEQQAELLRRRAAGELVNDTELDWSNLAEEIEEVGRSPLRAVQSHPASLVARPDGGRALLG